MTIIQKRLFESRFYMFRLFLYSRSLFEHMRSLFAYMRLFLYTYDTCSRLNLYDDNLKKEIPLFLYVYKKRRNICICFVSFYKHTAQLDSCARLHLLDDSLEKDRTSLAL